MQVLCLSEEKKIKKERKEKKRKKWQIIFKISSKTDNFLWYNSFESESMTIGSRVRYELVIINLLLLLCFGWMRMNLLVNFIFTQYTKVGRLVFGFNPLRNASGRKSDFFWVQTCAYQTCRDSRCWRVDSVHIPSRLRRHRRWHESCEKLVKETVYSWDPPHYFLTRRGRWQAH